MKTQLISKPNGNSPQPGNPRVADEITGIAAPTRLIPQPKSLAIQGAVLVQQNLTFAVVAMQKNVVDAELFIDACFALFPGMPITLVAQDALGRFTYYGRSDISRFLASIDATRIPWKEYTFTGPGQCGFSGFPTKLKSERRGDNPSR